MKNFKRILLLAMLAFIASQVLFSDFEIVKTENKVVAIVNE
ncbi:hypothetical protein [Algibacter sp. Ld11]